MLVNHHQTLGNPNAQSKALTATAVALLTSRRRGALTAAHLEALWVCAEGRHEATARVLLALALGLVPALAPHLRLCLFSCAAATPFSRYGPQTLQFVHDFTVSPDKVVQCRHKQFIVDVLLIVHLVIGSRGTCSAACSHARQPCRSCAMGLRRSSLCATSR